MCNIKYLLLSILLLAGLSSFAQSTHKQPVDYVNPYMGNISHLLVPTYPTVHLPNSLLRVYPERGDYTSNRILGLPVMISSHRGRSVFGLSIQYEGESLKSNKYYTYDNEIIKPYYYEVDLDEANVHVRFAPSHQSAIYEIAPNADKDFYLVLSSSNGELSADGGNISGYQELGGSPTKIYIYLETDAKPLKSEVIPSEREREKTIAFRFPAKSKVVVRYGISLISREQAEKNLRREIKTFNVDQIAEAGRNIWNEKLSKLSVTGDEERKVIFYTSLYRTYERMVNISEDGNYFSPFDGKVHSDEGRAFYNDDWIWDTYRAVHPLRILIEPRMESDMVLSFIRMAEQMENMWLPTFPEITGDSRRMNSNHGVATILDAHVKGLKGFDLEKGYLASKKAITEKTLAPWSSKKAGILDQFYKREGYFPALGVEEEETVPEVHSFERRQPVAVTLGTVYDEWCLGQLAKALNKKEEADYFLARSKNYRKIFNPETKFFHPKDSSGNFIHPFDYRYSGGIGARNAYSENNGWVYRWDVPHNVPDLVELMGGEDAFSNALDDMYNTSLGKSKYDFYSQIPDHTGNVGQFSMANEPSLHIPYLYNYAGHPWKTQKRIHTLIDQWFRNDLMGVPGDEDGGGLSGFVVFSMMGFYPVTPGSPIYVIGSPMFETTIIDLGNKKVKLTCRNYSIENKYIQSMKIDGKAWNNSWIGHQELINADLIEFTMGKYPNKNWAANPIHIE
ncbi:GH92 family glycosyl hydrolase [Proteiniphilum sp.]|nr:GH92 family glycosyl hydrolase [Proteiniphilum sp.]MEA4915976.1 GH92 family glycosyl hydrolase [Proteiniphilum sp.]